MARLIKRYENRKLYDSEARNYVSLEDIARLVREGVDVQVVDKTTGADLTTQTLTQVIFEEGKRGRNPLSAAFLHDLIRWGNSLIGDGIQQVRTRLDQIVPPTLNRLFNAGEAREIEQLRERVATLEAAIFKIAGESSEPPEDSSDTPTARE